MTEQDIERIADRGKNYPAFAPDPYTTMWVEQVSQRDIPALIAEVRRLQKELDRRCHHGCTHSDCVRCEREMDADGKAYSESVERGLL